MDLGAPLPAAGTDLNPAWFAPQLGLIHRRRLPLVLQTEAAECALACLAMISCYWGQMIDIGTLRRRFAISLKGATLRSVIELARALDLTSRPLKLELEHVSDLILPCILHWDLDHFVVLERIGRRSLVIHDPGVGIRRLSMAEFSRHFTGVALELSPAQSFRPQVIAARYSLLSLMGRLRGIGTALTQLLVLGLSLQVFALLLPQYLQWLVDQALLTGDRPLVNVLGLGFLLLVLTQTAIGAVRSWLTTRLSTSVNFQWFDNVFRHLLHLPLSYFDKRYVGDVVSRFGSIQTIQRGLTTQLVDGLIDGALVMLTLVMMFLYQVDLALVACSAVLLYLLLRTALFHRLKSATSEQIVHQARQSSHFLASVRGMQSIRLFLRTEDRRHQWMSHLAAQFNAELRIARLNLTFQSASTLIFSLERIAVVWLAALAVLRQDFTVGMLFAFLSYQDQFSQRTSALIDRLLDLRMLRVHAERVADIVFTQEEAGSTAPLQDIGEIEASLTCEQLSYRYADGEAPVLDGLSLHIPAGQCIAITGASGSGKTTLARLLLGLIEPQSGQILAGGLPLRQMGVTALRSMVGTVMQDDTLFAGSIAENIEFFSSAPDAKKVERCAGLAGLAADIEQMPMGYRSLIGDLGQGLSGGQKQRLLLARALYKDPRILILDEATSHLDLDSERLVNQAIRRLSLTRIMIAHRPETIAMADRIVVLDGGRIANDFLPTR
jgi:ATP-binding cassette subfamily B protein RaxB